jgi:periplasmic divalent cation tolerance protein
VKPATGEILILTTVGHDEDATPFARRLVEQRLAACVNIIPGVRSVFRWKSEDLSEEGEILLLIKSRRERLAEIEAFFRKEHPYEVPELLVIDAAAVSEAYGTWLGLEMGLNKGDA